MQTTTTKLTICYLLLHVAHGQLHSGGLHLRATLHTHHVCLTLSTMGQRDLIDGTLGGAGGVSGCLNFSLHVALRVNRQSGGLHCVCGSSGISVVSVGAVVSGGAVLSAVGETLVVSGSALHSATVSLFECF